MGKARQLFGVECPSPDQLRIRGGFDRLSTSCPIRAKVCLIVESLANVGADLRHVRQCKNYWFTLDIVIGKKNPVSGAMFVRQNSPPSGRQALPSASFTRLD